MQKNKSAQKKKFIAPEFWIGFLLGITVVAIGFFVYFRFFSPSNFHLKTKR
jgi:Mg/Co/Ni transporter MgtE